MNYCLAEGVREMHRQALRSAVVVSLHQDVGQSRLAVRFCCVDADLNQLWGLMVVMRVTDPRY
eukprot:893028-Lingulodinium_polyedra.AAC.1